MGSLNPMVVLPAAIQERGEAIAKGLAGSVLLGGGQFCTKPGLVFVVGDDRGFVDHLARQISGTACVTMLNKSLRDSFNARVSEFAHVPGVNPVVTSHPADHASASPGLLETSCDVWLREKRLREEAFGPATLVVRCRDVREAASGVRAVEGSLTGTVHIGTSDDVESIGTITRALEAVSGRMIVNGYPTGVCMAALTRRQPIPVRPLSAPLPFAVSRG
jgi:acyl-CoA reductase-like NAD-dependent aldehyde dehydrogenase